jgi:hypothetical protein
MLMEINAHIKDLRPKHVYMLLAPYDAKLARDLHNRLAKKGARLHVLQFEHGRAVDPSLFEEITEGEMVAV